MEGWGTRGVYSLSFILFLKGLQYGAGCGRLVSLATVLPNKQPVLST